MKISGLDASYDPSADTQWTPGTSLPQPGGTPKNNNPNNPFRNPNAFGALLPPPYEAHAGGSPSAVNNHSYNNSTNSNHGSAQSYPGETSESRFPHKGDTYQEQRQGSSSQHQSPPPTRPLSSDQYGGGYNANNQGPSHNLQGSYSSQSYPQQQMVHRSSHPSYQLHLGQSQEPPTQTESPDWPHGFPGSQYYDLYQLPVDKPGSSGGASGKNPPDPSLSQFGYLPPGNYPFVTAPPVASSTMGPKLDNGRSILSSPGSIDPHPFMSHDNTEEDRTRLLKNKGEHERMANQKLGLSKEEEKSLKKELRALKKETRKEWKDKEKVLSDMRKEKKEEERKERKEERKDRKEEKKERKEMRKCGGQS